MSVSRGKFSSEFKSKVVLESLKEFETIESLAKKYEIHPTQLSQWCSEALKNFIISKDIINLLIIKRLNMCISQLHKIIMVENSTYIRKTNRCFQTLQGYMNNKRQLSQAPPLFIALVSFENCIYYKAFVT